MVPGRIRLKVIPFVTSPATAAAETRAPFLEARKGVLFGVAAYGWWGFIPLYFKLVSHLPALEVVAHRTLWVLAMMGTILLLRGKIRKTALKLRDRRTLLALIGSTVFIASNWLTFVYAVNVDRVLHASLGYYINPLVSVLMGVLILKERLRGLQLVSLILAAAGVVVLTYYHGMVPWIALVLAVSFGMYGLIRKIADVDALQGLGVEALFLSPFAMLYLGWLASHGESAFIGGTLADSLVLPLAGPVTAIPLIWFVAAAKRLRLATVGFLQYIAPTLQFTLAVLAFGEEFTPYHAVCFGLIWAGLGLYSWDTWRSARPAS